MSQKWLGKAPRLTTSSLRQVLRSAPDPGMGRPASGPDLERAVSQAAAPSPSAHTSIPAALWGPPAGSPADPGDEVGGAELTA